MEYLKECIEEAFCDAKITATDSQIKTVVMWISSAFENYGMHTGAPSAKDEEIKRLNSIIDKENSKVRCHKCGGTGMSSNIQTEDCFMCNGSGFIY